MRKVVVTIPLPPNARALGPKFEEGCGAMGMNEDDSVVITGLYIREECTNDDIRDSRCLRSQGALVSKKELRVYIAALQAIADKNFPSKE